MAIVLGIRPGGRYSFAVAALYWTGKLPGKLVAIRSHSGVQAVLDDLMGIVGEWGELTAAAVDAPLTWNGSPTGWRKCDDKLREMLPEWAPKSWIRSPNAMPGAVGIQGPALTWSMALEKRHGNLPEYRLFESHPRLSMARAFRDAKKQLIGYRQSKTPAEEKRAHIDYLLDRFVDAGALSIETDRPSSVEELEATVCAITAMGDAFDASGIVTHRIEGGVIRPVGRRDIVILSGLS